jgi:lycopene beta-cyclase
MSYWFFHLVFILPVIGVLLYVNSRGKASPFPRYRLGFALIAVVALAYTTPWDNYLIYRGVWSYSPERISESLKLGYVPLEEYCFFLLQPVLTGLYLLFFGNRYRDLVVAWLCPNTRAAWPRVLGGSIGVGFGALGCLALIAGGPWTYFGLILAWACPVLAFHWFYGGDHLWRARPFFGATLVSATVYLCVVDRIALEWKIWSISPLYSTGWNFIGLHLEEATFFLVTNLLVIQGLLLFFKFIHTRALAKAT